MLIAGCGGFAGTCGRYLVGKVNAGNEHSGFPILSFMLNLVSCMMAGLLFGIIEHRGYISSAEAVLLIVGFSGGFAAFSSFSDDIWALSNNRSRATINAYIALSIVSGLALLWLGRIIAI